MPRTARAFPWWGAGIAGLGVLAAALVWTTAAARRASRVVRMAVSQPGPPVSEAALPGILNGVPVAPFMALDVASSNDPRVRLMAGFTFHRGGGRYILAFASSQSFDRTERWYQANLPGWTRTTQDARWNSHDDRAEERWRSGIRIAAWRRGRASLALVALPDLPGRVLLILPAR